MPDCTIASAMPLMRSSLTLQANLFQEFHPMGGVSARLAEGEAFSCASRQGARSSSVTNRMDSDGLVFMQTFYQKRLRIGTERSHGDYLCGLCGLALRTLRF